MTPNNSDRKSVSLKLATHLRLGVLFTFNGTADAWANYDPETHGYRAVRQDSFLTLTGCRSTSLPFEFVRRLAWRVSNRSGMFAGVIVMRGPDTGFQYYDQSNRITTLPEPSDLEPRWQHLGDATAYFPRSIDDMVPLINEECHDSIVYLGLADEDGWITRLDEDDEWYVYGDAETILPVMKHVAVSLGLPLTTGTFHDGVALAVWSHVPRIEVLDGHITLSRELRAALGSSCPAKQAAG